MSAVLSLTASSFIRATDFSRYSLMISDGLLERVSASQLPYRLSEEGYRLAASLSVR